jgi:DNA-binding GntR family transcriptional regulator
MKYIAGVLYIHPETMKDISTISETGPRRKRERNPMSKHSAYQLIRERIILGDYSPGEPLKEKEMMAELGLGRTPLREILIRLDTEGLVQIVPYGGIYVTTVNLQDLISVVEVRRPLLEMAARLAAARTTPEDITEMRAIWAELDQDLPHREMIRLDGELHERINAASQNSFLRQIMRTLRDRVLRMWLLPQDKGFTGEFRRDFDAIITAIEQRDPETAAGELTRHAGTFTSRIKDQL